jgi:hypothetical protein
VSPSIQNYFFIIYTTVTNSSLWLQPIFLGLLNSFQHVNIVAPILNDNFVALVCEQTIPTKGPPLVSEVSANFYGYRGVAQSAQQIPYDRNLTFLYRSRCFVFQVALQLYSRSWVDPVPDILLLRKSGSARNQTRTSGSVARNSDH